MSLDDVIDLSITAQTKTATRAGFGTPMVLAYHNVTANRLDLFSSPKAMTDAGFPITSPAYLAALKIFSQNPRPTKVAIGKRTRAYTQTIELTPVNLTAGFHYQFDIVDPTGVVTSIDYVVLAGATVTSVSTALVALLGAITNVTATVVSTKVHLVCAAGKLFNLKNLPQITDMKVDNLTADPGIASDLAEVTAVDGGASWYGVTLDSNSKAEVVALAAANEATRKLFFYDVIDSGAADNAISTDVLSVLKATADARPFGLFNSRELLGYGAAALLGQMLALDPGSATFAYKTLASVTVDTISDGQAANIAAKNGNFYTVTGGINVTQKGVMADGSFADVIWFLDWLHARIQERIFGILANSKKIPYTDSGVDIIRGAILAQLQQGIAIGGLANDPAPSVTVPKVKDVDPADRINRFLPNVTFSAQLAGAIHSMKIGGVVTV